MKSYPECLSCFRRQTEEAVRTATADARTAARITAAVSARLAEFSSSTPPPVVGREIHRLIRELAGNDDPYREIKARSNNEAATLYPRLKRTVRKAREPFETAARLALAGNVVDFGVAGNGDGLNLEAVIEDALHKPLAVDHLARLRRAIKTANHILYLGDNAGEVFFDRLFIEELPTERVTFAVRGGPVINDATREDAEQAGLPELVKVVETGADAPGAVLELCSAEFRRRFDEADVVVAKGQGNYETLDDRGKQGLFFLLMVKCPVVARHTGCRQGDFLVKENA